MKIGKAVTLHIMSYLVYILHEICVKIHALKPYLGYSDGITLHA